MPPKGKSKVLTYKEQKDKQKQRKATRDPWGTRRSRKLQYQKMRAAVMDSTGVVRHGNFMKSMSWANYCAFYRSSKQSKATPSIIDPASSDEEEKEQAAEGQDNSIIDLVSSDDERDDTFNPADWPLHVREIDHCENPEGIALSDTGSFDPCGCTMACIHKDEDGDCLNASLGYFCDASNCNCRLGSSCGNRIVTKPGLVLVRGRTGLSVMTTKFIAAGESIAPYWGVLTTYDYEADESNQSEYALATDETDKDGNKIYVEATEAGRISRFMDHACNAKARFVQRRYRRKLVMMVVAVEDIHPGEDVTVWYGDELWFTCMCNTPNCS